MEYILDLPSANSSAGSDFGGHVSITLAFIEPGNPVQNAFIERFNGRFWDECLSEHWFLDLVDAEATIKAGRFNYKRATGRTNPR